MNILLSLTDISFVSTKSIGIYNVAMGLARGLMQSPDIEQLHLLGNCECAQQLGQLPPHVHLHLADKKVPRRFSRIYWDQWGVQRAIRRIQPDWAILPKGFPPYFPQLGTCKLACYLHDINWEYYQGLKQGKQSPYPRHQLAYFSRLGIRCLEKADLVLTSTQFNKSRYSALRPQSKTAVIGIGFDHEPQSCEAPTQRGKNLLVYVSPYPHKRSDLVLPRLQAWLAQRKDAEEITIYLLGRRPEGFIVPAKWKHIAQLPFTQLQQLLLEDCRASIYFSDYEGYGMPPVESLRLGIPCLASDIPPIRENIPERYLFPNDDAESFITRLNHCYDHPDTSDTPTYPNWQEVAQRAIHAMKEAKPSSNN